MVPFAFLVLVVAGGISIHLCVKRAYRLGYSKGYADADENGETLDDKHRKIRLALAATTAELERLRDELLKRDAGSYVRSL